MLLFKQTLWCENGMNSLLQLAGYLTSWDKVEQGHIFILSINNAISEDVKFKDLPVVNKYIYLKLQKTSLSYN